jgi:hypothetical protein
VFSLSLVDDTHIGLQLDVVLTFLQLQKELLAFGFLVLPLRCVVWSPQGLNHSISFPLGFLILDLGFCILGALVESTSFVESFIEAFREDLGTIFNLLMLANLQTTFAMFSLCYAQRPGYLLCIMFPFPRIL